MVCGGRAWAQVSDPALVKELAQLGAAAEELDNALPSFTCKETGTSQVRRGRKVIRDVTFSATLRAHRINEAGAHNETFNLTELNGQPYTGGYAFPLYVSGGFDKGMRYFSPRLQPCYIYALLPGRIDFATAPDVEEHPQCRNEKLQGFALLDGDGNVTHVERRVPIELANQSRLAPFSAIDFAPVDLNGRIFRLSQHMVSEHSYEQTTARFEVTYTDCKLFVVTVKLLPADSGPKREEAKVSSSAEPGPAALVAGSATPASKPADNPDVTAEGSAGVDFPVAVRVVTSASRVQVLQGTAGTYQVLETVIDGQPVELEAENGGVLALGEYKARVSASVRAPNGPNSYDIYRGYDLLLPDGATRTYRVVRLGPAPGTNP
jgi:hypothetical protein